MAIIPLGRPALAETGDAEASRGLRLRLPIGLGGLRPGAVGSGREEAARRAIAAAAALAAPARAAGLVREAKEYPEAVLSREVDAKVIESILEEVARFLDDESGAPGPTEVERQVAAAIGARPALVAAAYGKLLSAKGDPIQAAAEHALYWVVQDGGADLLARVAPVARRLTHLRVRDRLGDIAQLRTDLKALTERVKALEEKHEEGSD